MAVGHALGNRAALSGYTEAGFLTIDNNAGERALRAVAVERLLLGRDDQACELVGGEDGIVGEAGAETAADDLERVPEGMTAKTSTGSARAGLRITLPGRTVLAGNVGLLILLDQDEHLGNARRTSTREQSNRSASRSAHGTRASTVGNNRWTACWTGSAHAAGLGITATPEP